MFGLNFNPSSFIPFACLLCGIETRGGAIICAHCRHDLPDNRSGCRLCGAPVFGSMLCGTCVQRPPALDQAIVPFRYSYPVDSLIKKFKYDQKIMAAAPLVDGLVGRISNETVRLPDAMTPVPLHRSRLYARGYNQAQEICRLIGRRLPVPVEVPRRHGVRPLPGHLHPSNCRVFAGR